MTQRVLEAPQPGLGHQLDEDRRTTSRYAWNYAPLVSCVMVAPGRREEQVIVADVSKEGAGIVVRGAPPAVGTQVFLVVTNRAEVKTRTLQFVVAHVTPRSRGRHLVGGRFRRPLSFDELAELFFRSE